jgi:hypothetical protein
MQSGFTPALRLLTACVIVAMSALTPVSARTPAIDASLERDSALDAEEMFSDAPFGVDPMVTGPVSGEFAKRQRDLGCAEAKWPNVPAACYPR